MKNPISDANFDGLSKNIENNIETGLIAYWSFDNETNLGHDDSSNAHNGINHGASWISNGVYGGAIDFERLDENYIEVPSPVINTPPYSICAWVKPETLPFNDNWYFVCNGGATSHSYGFAFYINGLIYPDPQWTFAVKRSDAIAGTVFSPIESNNWTFLCGTWDGSINNNSIKLYINGNLVGLTTPIESIVNGPERNLMIGKDSEGQGSDVDNLWYDGIIDEVRIYNRVLNQDEIYDLMSYNNHMKPSANFSIRQTNDPSIIEINYVSNRNMSEVK